MLGILGSLASSILPSLFKGGGIIKTIGDIGKKLIAPVGTKLFQAGKDAIGNLLEGDMSGVMNLGNTASSAFNDLMEGAKSQTRNMATNLINRGYKKANEYRKMAIEAVNPSQKRKRKRKKQEQMEIEDEIPIKKQIQREPMEDMQYMYNEGSGGQYDHEI